MKKKLEKFEAVIDIWDFYLFYGIILFELIALTSNFDIKITSTLNRINNEITHHPVESFVKLVDTVDDLPESNFDHSNHESRKFTRNSYSGCNDTEPNCFTSLIAVFSPILVTPG